MKFILDANLSPRLSAELNAAGCNTQHVAELGLLRASDIEIVNFAKKRRLRKPSIITVRQVERLNVAELFELLISAINTNHSLLRRGGIVVVEPGSIRLRTLPLTENARD